VTGVRLADLPAPLRRLVDSAVGDLCAGDRAWLRKRVDATLTELRRRSTLCGIK
jgi:hypothetical protein